MTDQFLLYDQALTTWLNTSFGSLLPGQALRILLATPKRAFADVMSGKLVNNDTLTIPRITVTRGDETIDSSRFNSNRLRRLGWKYPTVHSHIKSANFPAPVSIPYQVDLWTKYSSEMNIWLQKVITLFASTIVYLRVRPNDVYGDKIYPLVITQQISNTSEVEPGQFDRAMRRTISLRADCWIFDEAYVSVPIARRLSAEYRDSDTSALYDTDYLPPIEVIGTGDGVTKHFTVTLQRPPVLQHTIVIQTLVGGATKLVLDDTSGNLVLGTTPIGTITYTPGTVDITFPTAPDNGAAISVTYFTDLS